jgi:hypothetical protein
MRKEVIYIDGRELKMLLNGKDFIYFNGYKYYFTPQDIQKLEDSKTYVLFQKYGMLFVKPLSGGKSIIVKRGEKVPKGG